MSLIGTYKNDNTGETLQITSADDSNGSLSGTLQTTVDGKSYNLNVTGHYHYFNNTGSATNITLYATISGAAVYEAWSGVGDSSSGYSQLRMMGARSTMESNDSTDAIGLGGTFNRT